MLLLNDRTRKLSAIGSALWMITLSTLPSVTALAEDAAFAAGRAAGQAGVAQINQVLAIQVKYRVWA